MKRELLLRRLYAVTLSAAALLSGCSSENSAGGAGGTGGQSSTGDAGGIRQDTAAGSNFLFQAGVTKNESFIGAGPPRAGGGYVYWRWDPGQFEGREMRRLQRKGVEGGSVEDVVGPALIDDYQADAEHVYWLEKGQMWRRPHQAGPAQQVTQNLRNALNFTLGNNFILTWSSLAESFTLVPKSPGELAVQVERNRILSVVADADVFYVMTSVNGASLGQATGTITAVEAGMAPRKVLEGISGPGRLLGVVGTKVYLTTESSLAGGRLKSLDKLAGGQLEAVGNEGWRFNDGVISDGILYATANNAFEAGGSGQWKIVRYQLGGASWVDIERLKDIGPGHAVSGNWMFWINTGNLYRTPKL